MNTKGIQSYTVACGIAALLAVTSIQSFGQTPLFEDKFDTDTSSAWGVFNGSSSGTPDYTVLFAFDYTTNRVTINGVTGTIPPAPNGGGKGVKMWVNKNDDVAETAAVSIYPIGKSFEGEFALKFDMWQNYNGGPYGGTGSTEFATFGVDHTGDKVNWANVGYPSDGVWFAVSGEGGSGTPTDYVAYVGDGYNPATSYSGGDVFLDRDGDGTAEAEVNDLQPAGYPLNLMFPSPEYETRAMPSKHWVQVEIRQRTNEFGAFIYTWLINNYVIAQHSYPPSASSGTIMLGNMDTFSSIANPKADNFVIYDNVRVVSLAGVAPLPVVTIVTNDPVAAEPADAGSVTITRYGSTDQPLTVNYRVQGTASPGTDYAALPGALLFAAGQSATNLTIAPINDALGEPVESITVVLTGTADYDLYTNIAAVVTLEDDGDTPVVNLFTTRTNAYERNPDNAGRFRINLSNPSSFATTVNFGLSGSAVPGVDYTAVAAPVTIPAGETNAVLQIRPVNNNLADGNRTVTLSVAAGSGYSLGTTTTGTVTIRDDDFLPLGALLYSENFDQDHSAEWRVNPSAGDHPADLFFEYSTTAGVPLAPNSAGPEARGAKLQANLSGGVFGGVSISPLNLNLSGDFILRVDLWQNFNGPAPGGGSGSTQITGAGVGTAGATAQWPGGTQDSVWFAATGDGGSTVDYRAYSSAAATGYTDGSGVFAAGTTGNPRAEANPYYYEFGGNEPPAEQAANFPNQTGSTYPGAQAFVWRDVAIQKQGTTVKWWIDGKLLATVNADATNFAAGNILLMHSDINATTSGDVNSPYMAFGLFDNVRVYALAAPASRPNITVIGLINNGTQAQIDFTGETADVPGNFHVQSSLIPSSGFTDVNTAQITQLSPGQFRATLATNGPYQFYRIRR